MKIAPLDASGKVGTGYSVTRMAGDISCYVPSPSAVAADIVSCGSAADGADVCWVKSDRVTVLCGVSPWVMTLREFTLTDSIKEMKPGADPLPWAMELDGGDKCTRRIGGAVDTLPFGLIPAYYCQDPNHIIVVDVDGKLFDKSSGKWTVQTANVSEAVKSGSRYKLPPRKTVATVYFAG
ncbi:hypothetical protein [Streptacidiphilus sp. EB103A]|uniref:hypothetical protein n=1 Tax=Streptacidiphilus sp. EB103A TaxID=3156275 RepID=UPI0035192164